MILAYQLCGPYQAAAVIAAVIAAVWGIYNLVRVCKRLRPWKPECQSCGWFINCSMAQVKKCPRQKPWYYRLWRHK